MERFTKLYRELYPEDRFGIYTNVMGSTGEGRDLAIVGFLDNYADMAKENPDVPKQYDEMFGKGSYEKDMQTWVENTEGSAAEMWAFMPKLSSRPAEVKVAQN